MAGVRGQGRKFDLDDAADRAMLVFWTHGYEGTSISMLTQAMGINSPSLYAAFGDKEGVFFAAIDRYDASRGKFMQRAFDDEVHSPDLIDRLLRDAASHYGDPSFPGGCLKISSAVCVSQANQHVADRLRDMRNDNIDQLVSRISDNVADGSVPPSVDPLAAASFVGAVIQGMSQRARDGAGVSELMHTATLTTVALAGMGLSKSVTGSAVLPSGQS